MSDNHDEKNEEEEEDSWLDDSKAMILALTSQDSQTVVDATQVEEESAEYLSPSLNTASPFAAIIYPTNLSSSVQQLRRFEGGTSSACLPTATNQSATTTTTTAATREASPTSSEHPPERTAALRTVSSNYISANENIQSTAPRNVSFVEQVFLEEQDEKRRGTISENEDSFSFQYTPTTHAVPVHELTDTNNDNSNNNNEEDSGEALIQRLLQQDAEEQMVAVVVAVPTNPAEEQEIQELRHSVRTLHDQLQRQDAEVRQLRQQLESLSSTTSSSNSETANNIMASSSRPTDDNRPTKTSSAWKRRYYIICGVSSCIVAIIVSVVVFAGSKSSYGQYGDSPAGAPTIVASTSQPSSTFWPTESPPGNGTLPTSFGLRPTAHWPPRPGPSVPTPSPDGLTPGASSSFDSIFTVEIISVIAVVCIVLVALGCLAFVFVRRKGQAASAADDSLAGPTKSTRSTQQQEHLKAEVSQALLTLLSSRLETARRLQAILQQPKPKAD